jgi:phenylpropionate dioxygenase-like ring-hydroxylating dioxygenase large terminal subunit
MATRDDTWPRSLVQDDRVNRAVYRDPEVFDLEMDRIFKRTWLYVGHESQVPKAGDFVTSKLAGQPIVIVRHHADNNVYVLFNRCGHRGAVVTTHDRGNVTFFRCCYHGWTFKTDGSPHGIPLREGYANCYDLAAPEFGMMRLPRVDSYRGFIFASFSPNGPSLLTHLGPMKDRIDDLVDRAPAGEIIVSGGVHKYRFRGNWKLQIENLNDMYHPHASHESTVGASGRQFRRGERSGEGAELKTDHSGNPLASWDESGVWACENGHGWCGSMPGTTGGGSGPVFEKYLALLRNARGEARAQELLNLKWHNAIVYPNLVIQAMAQHIRVIHPVAVNLTEIHIYPIMLKGAPEEMDREIIRYLNVTHAPASLIQTDDLEAFRRVQGGVETQGSDWVVFGRGYGLDVQSEGPAQRAFGTSELPIRNQYKAWAELMSEELA